MDDACAGQELTERRCRRDVAACYRLLHRHGLSDMTDGFVAARLPSSPSEVIIGGYGLFPEAARPQDLFRRRLADPPGVEKLAGVDVDALLFSRAVLGARADLNAVIHAHSPRALVFSTLDIELMPIFQWGLMFHGRIGAVPFDEDVSSSGACRMIAWHLAQGKEAILLRNHGLIVPGRSVADAFFSLYRIEQTFGVQLEALKTGAPLVPVDPQTARYWSDRYWSGEDSVDNDGSREWPGFLRLLAAEDPAFGTD